MYGSNLADESRQSRAFRPTGSHIRLRAFIVPHSTAISKGIGIYGETRYYMVGACFVEHPWMQKRQRQEKRRRLDCGQETSGTYLPIVYTKAFLLDAARNQPAVSQCQHEEIDTNDTHRSNTTPLRIEKESVPTQEESKCRSTTQRAAERSSPFSFRFVIAQFIISQSTRLLRPISWPRGELAFFSLSRA